MSSESGGGELVLFSTKEKTPVLYPLSYGLKSPVHRLSISWGCGNNLRVTVLRNPELRDDDDGEVGGKVVNVRLSGEDGEISDPQWRRIAYGSVSPFALLQSRRNSISSLSKMDMSSSLYQTAWWEYVMEYSRDIKSLLSNTISLPAPLIEDPRSVIKVRWSFWFYNWFECGALLMDVPVNIHMQNAEEPTSLKAAWELMELFYADKTCLSWLPERLVDWLSAIEDDPRYWEVMASALSVGWLEIVVSTFFLGLGVLCNLILNVKLLHLHGSYQLDQLGHRETRERWQSQITKLECSAFWVQCAHHQTREGLRNMLKIMIGNADCLRAATCNWMELFVSHLLYLRPFTKGLDGMHSLAQKCVQSKPVNTSHKLLRLLIGILGENTESVPKNLAPGRQAMMVAHAMELLTAGSEEGEVLVHEEQRKLGGINMEELHRLVYAQVLSSHALTWQIAPIYLASCEKQGLGLLELLFYRQPVQENQMLIKDLVRSLHLISGVHHWKHGRKGSGIFWLQQARDENCLSVIAQQLFDSVGKSLSDESLKQWEGLVELLGSESQISGGLDFLHKYRDFKRSLKVVHDGKTIDAAHEAVERLVSVCIEAVELARTFAVECNTDQPDVEQITRAINSKESREKLAMATRALLAVIYASPNRCYISPSRIKIQSLTCSSSSHYYQRQSRKNHRIARSYSSDSDSSVLQPPDVARLAQTARISLTPAEVLAFSLLSNLLCPIEECETKIRRVIDWFGQLQQVDVNSVEPAIRAG
ncbi:putative protein [Arabidopsis thaliana]|nr:putative protein [Arabidopsis thaliana]CAB80008.1 putative protein [Arabidopsis thaliana]